MSYIGDIRLGNTFDTKFTTRQISGAPATLASSPVISCYVGNGTTELTAGITLTVDFDARTGLNNIRVVATGGNGYAATTDNQLVITTGTVNSVSVVGEVVGEFSLENRSAVMPTTIGRTLSVDSSGRALSDVDTIKTNPVVNGGTITFPTTATLASTTNITAGTISTVTTLTNLPAITANWLTAAGINAAALNGKGDWMVTYTQPTGFLAANFTTGIPITSSIKQNQALANFEFLMTDSTNHAPATGLVVTVTRSIDGGAFAAGALSAVTEVSNGVYRVDFAASDLNGKVITLRATAAASDDTFERILTQV